MCCLILVGFSVLNMSCEYNLWGCSGEFVDEFVTLCTCVCLQKSVQENVDVEKY
jgi:hypothetical protein